MSVDKKGQAVEQAALYKAIEAIESVHPSERRRIIAAVCAFFWCGFAGEEAMTESGKFLERARELQKYANKPETAMARAQVDYWSGSCDRLSFMDKCWPEILVVVEAAWKRRHACADECPACLDEYEALDALDRKAGWMQG